MDQNQFCNCWEKHVPPSEILSITKNLIVQSAFYQDKEPPNIVRPQTILYNASQVPILIRKLHPEIRTFEDYEYRMRDFQWLKETVSVWREWYIHYSDLLVSKKIPFKPKATVDRRHESQRPILTVPSEFIREATRKKAIRPYWKQIEDAQRLQQLASVSSFQVTTQDTRRTSQTKFSHVKSISTLPQLPEDQRTMLRTRRYRRRLVSVASQKEVLYKQRKEKLRTAYNQMPKNHGISGLEHWDRKRFSTVDVGDKIFQSKSKSLRFLESTIKALKAAAKDCR